MDQHIDTYIEFFPTSRQAAGRSSKTVQSYRWHLDVFRSWAEEEGLTDITAITIEDLDLEEGKMAILNPRKLPRLFLT
jgi:site-specific recombinase XerD